VENSGTLVEIPDFVVRQVGVLQLQLAAAHEEIRRLNEELSELRLKLQEKVGERAGGAVP